MKALGLLLLATGAALAQPVPDEPPPPPPDQSQWPADQPPGGAQKPPPTEPNKPVEPNKPAELPKFDKNGKPIKYEPLIRHGIAPELTIAGGVRVAAGDNDHVRRFMGRIRAGVTLFSEPNFLVAGVTGTIGTLDSSSIGVEVGFINMITGIWLQGGWMPIDSTDGQILSATFGYALFGLEYQRRVSGSQKDEQSLTITLQVPLGVLKVLLD